MALVAEMVDPHCAHISKGGRGATSSWHHLGGKHAPPVPNCVFYEKNIVFFVWDWILLILLRVDHKH